MMLFNPDIQIQRSDEITDWTMITSVELMGIRSEENLPAGTDRRLLMTTLEFEMPIFISAPANVHDKYIKDNAEHLSLNSWEKARCRNWWIVASHALKR